MPACLTKSEQAVEEAFILADKAPFCMTMEERSRFSRLKALGELSTSFSVACSAGISRRSPKPRPRRTSRPYRDWWYESVAADPQPRQARGRLTVQMFVSSLAAEPKLLARLCDREPVALRHHDKSCDLLHQGDVVPGHSAWKCKLSLLIKCQLSRRFIPLFQRTRR